MRMIPVVGVVLALSVGLAAQGAGYIPPGSKVFIEDSDFGQALSAGMVKKKVPLTVTTQKESADYFLDEVSKATKEGTGERVAKVLAFGVFAGSGKTYEASVRFTNMEGVVLWAHNSEKRDVRRAAEDVAERLGDYIKKQRRP